MDEVNYVSRKRGRSVLESIKPGPEWFLVILFHRIRRGYVNVENIIKQAREMVRHIPFRTTAVILIVKLSKTSADGTGSSRVRRKRHSARLR
jgi:hypothetical protein